MKQYRMTGQTLDCITVGDPLLCSKSICMKENVSGRSRDVASYQIIKVLQNAGNAATHHTESPAVTSGFPEEVPAGHVETSVLQRRSRVSLSSAR